VKRGYYKAPSELSSGTPGLSGGLQKVGGRDERVFVASSVMKSMWENRGETKSLLRVSARKGIGEREKKSSKPFAGNNISQEGVLRPYKREKQRK